MPNTSSILLGTATMPLKSLLHSSSIPLGWFPTFIENQNHSEPLAIGAVQARLTMERPLPISSTSPAMASSPVAVKKSQPFDCRVTVEVEEISPPSTLSKATGFFVLYQFFGAPEPVSSETVEPSSSTLDRKNLWLPIQHSSTFIVTNNAEFTCYLRAEKLQVQLWATSQSG